MRSRWTRVSMAVLVVTAIAACAPDTPAAPTPLTLPAVGSPTLTAPAIVTAPADRTINSGQATTLEVAASGSAPLLYQWYAGPSGTITDPIAGASSSNYATPALTATSSFWVRVSNAAGIADSSAAVVTVIVPPPPPPPPSGPDAAVLALEDQVLTLVNQRRAAGATCGGTARPAVAPLTMNAPLRIAARNHSEDMAVNGYFSHTSLDGRTFDQRIRNAGYTGASPLGENIAAGYGSAQAVVDGWMASPGHCTNIMSAGFRAIGVGYAFRAGSPFGHYWTQSFGGS